MSSAIHRKRALRWQASEFNAEWIQNAMDYCRTDPQGKRGFEASLVAEFGEEGSRKVLLDCNGPPRRRVTGRAPQEGVWWAQAAFDLGLSDQAVVMYIRFAHTTDVAAPPRVLPAIKRRRGEGSIEWLARRNRAHIDGHKVPEMDWITARAIAISEFDRVRDTWEGWHTSPEVFFDELLQRGKTIILSPQVLENPDKDWVRRHKIDDAFRGRVYSLTLAHMVWLHASELLEDLIDVGLTTSSQIERAYKKDRKLMLRLIACYSKMEGLSLHLWSNMEQVLSASPNIAPCVVRSRGYRGKPQITRNYSAAGRAAHELLNELEMHIVEMIVTDGHQAFALCDVLMKALAKDPQAADRFDAGALEVISELAIGEHHCLRMGIYEFLMQMELSTFGKGLIVCARALDGTEEDLWAHMCPLIPPPLPTHATFNSPWGATYYTTVAVRNIWLKTASALNMQGDRGPNGLLARIERREYLPPANFDEMWATYDLMLWEKSAPRALKGHHRALARHFGLYDVADETRPTCTRRLLREYFARARNLNTEYLARARELNVEVKTPLSAGTAGSARVTDHAIVPSQTVAQSARAYLAESGLTTKEKTKTRKDPGETEPPLKAHETLDEEKEKDEVIPEFLPSGYKLGKKVLKVFHRILEEDDAHGADETDIALQKGQIRWDVFEKAMKRIGFSVCQTAGSSVRFDPPAKCARPITFHRPHPDSLLTPYMIKWIGARLKRNYGWTTAVFTLGADTE
ncbi:hypothetical protein C8R47DRAFT_1201521 [Mycena vitilis]|nr:hypothetical protein C8R47DRAFT_1201521 [Mycena vitilis]